MRRDASSKRVASDIRRDYLLISTLRPNAAPAGFCESSSMTTPFFKPGAEAIQRVRYRVGAHTIQVCVRFGPTQPVLREGARPGQPGIQQAVIRMGAPATFSLPLGERRSSRARLPLAAVRDDGLHGHRSRQFRWHDPDGTAGISRPRHSMNFTSARSTRRNVSRRDRQAAVFAGA